ncbi:MAG: hypothetical protein M0P99_09575, partial [Candidatus Cloacimonetes bacterium]|nr:hypothetical protein [Candidatus Cloacimonadota bacterium]
CSSSVEQNTIPAKEQESGECTSFMCHLQAFRCKELTDKDTLSLTYNYSAASFEIKQITLQHSAIVS